MSTRGFMRRLLPGDESFIAVLGLGAAAVVIATSGALWWLTSYSQRQTLAEARAGMLGILSDSMGQSIETLLAGGEVSAVRRLVSDTARDGGLAVCRLTLADGSIIADSDASRITAQTLPESWPRSGSPRSEPELRTIELSVPGKGVAYLAVSRGLEGDLAAGPMDLLVGLVAAGSLGGLGLVYRFGRRRTRGLGVIHEALESFSRGETEPAALEISPSFGAPAQAWNGLLRELLSLRKQQLVRSMLGADQSAGTHREDSLSGACDALWHGVVVTDESMTIRYANGAAAVFLSARREALPGQDLGKCVRDAGVAGALRGLTNGSSRGRVVVESGLGAARDDAVFRVSARQLAPRAGSDCLILIEDVTQQRVADRSRNAFVAQATHELRTPLTNIRLYVENLLDKPDADEAVRSQHLNVVNQEVRRLERIVGDMLSVSEIEAGTMKLATDDVRVDALVKELEADFSFPARSKNIQLSFVVPPKLPVIVGDRDKLVLALGNPIGNALKYTPQGGQVTVGVQPDGDSLKVDVTDTGIGIAEDETELVFDRFYRSKDKRIEGITGSGLGLALARQVVRLHGGDITLASRINKGSTFTLTLPARAPMSLAA